MSLLQKQHPDFAKARDENKYEVRYPRGESYYDLVQRLEPCILEMERTQNNLLVVCHQAVGRCLLAYFLKLNNPKEEIPYLELPLHKLIKITPPMTGGGCSIEYIDMNVECVSTHRARTISKW